jgi:hypothetical protein
MKTIAIMQPYLFPYLGYFQIVNAVDEFVVYDDVQFITGGWINRNNFLVGGRKKLVTLALAGASRNKLINEIDIMGDFDKFRATLSHSYARAPHRAAVLELVDEIFAYPDRNLSRFVGNSVVQISRHVGLATTFWYSSQLPAQPHLRGQERIIHRCRLMNATDYVNAIGGRALYHRDDFAHVGVRLHFLRSRCPPYQQFRGEFVPELSILDVLMFNPPELVHKMLDDYELD